MNNTLSTIKRRVGTLALRGSATQLKQQSYEREVTQMHATRRSFLGNGMRTFLGIALAGSVAMAATTGSVAKAAGGNVYQYNGIPLNWTQIGTPASSLAAGGTGLFAIG